MEAVLQLANAFNSEAPVSFLSILALCVLANACIRSKNSRNHGYFKRRIGFDLYEYIDWYVLSSLFLPTFLKGKCS